MYTVKIINVRPETDRSKNGTTTAAHETLMADVP